MSPLCMLGQAPKAYDLRQSHPGPLDTPACTLCLLVYVPSPMHLTWRSSRALPAPTCHPLVQYGQLRENGVILKTQKGRDSFAFIDFVDSAPAQASRQPAWQRASQGLPTGSGRCGGCCHGQQLILHRPRLLGRAPETRMPAMRRGELQCLCAVDEALPCCHPAAADAAARRHGD